MVSPEKVNEVLIAALLKFKNKFNVPSITNMQFYWTLDKEDKMQYVLMIDYKPKCTIRLDQIVNVIHAVMVKGSLKKALFQQAAENNTAGQNIKMVVYTDDGLQAKISVRHQGIEVKKMLINELI